jgi:hypothetical protein
MSTPSSVPTEELVTIPRETLRRVRNTLEDIADGMSQVRRGRGGQGISMLYRGNMMAMAREVLGLLTPSKEEAK